MPARIGRIVAIGLGVVALAILGSSAQAQVDPPGPPDLPTAPDEVDPALELVTPLHEATTGSVCATAGGALALAGIVVPGTVPEVAPEVTLALRWAMWAHGNACSVTPPQYSHTACAPDDEVDAAIPDDDLVAKPGPVGGAVVDTVSGAEDEATGAGAPAPGAADELYTQLDCREDSRLLDGGGLSPEELAATPPMPGDPDAGGTTASERPATAAGDVTVSGDSPTGPAVAGAGLAAAPAGNGDGSSRAALGPGGTPDPAGPAASATARQASSTARWGAGIVVGAIALALLAANVVPAATGAGAGGRTGT